MNFHIPRKPGDIDVWRMHTIQMMPAELQANNKKAGHEAMWFAKKYKLLPDGQIGSHKGHRSLTNGLKAGTTVESNWVVDQLTGITATSPNAV